jgi:hypothetical protein
MFALRLLSAIVFLGVLFLVYSFIEINRELSAKRSHAGTRPIWSASHSNAAPSISSHLAKGSEPARRPVDFYFMPSRRFPTSRGI